MDSPAAYSRIKPLLLYALYFFLGGIVVWCIDAVAKEQLKNVLSHWMVWNLRIDLLLILAGTLICLPDLGRAFRDLGTRQMLLLAGVVLIGLMLAGLVAPRIHRIFFDEDIYASVGQNIALLGKTGVCNYGTFEYGEYTAHWLTYNKEPSGWPFLLSLAFQVLGTSEIYAFLLNNLFFGASLVVVFFIARLVSGRNLAGFLAAITLACTPHNIIWSNTGAAEPAAAFFSGLTVLALLVALRTGKGRHLFLFAVLLPFTCQMRPESVLMVGWAGLALLLLKPHMLADRKLWLAGLAAMLLALPIPLHLYAVSGESWGAEGARFSLGFFAKNLSVNGPYFFNNREYPLLFSLLALVGLARGGAAGKVRLLLLSWFFLFWGIFLFFYAGSYHYGADVRFSLLIFQPLAVLAGLGAVVCGDVLARLLPATESRFQPGIVLVLLVLAGALVGFLPQVRLVGQEAWGARYDHFYSQQFMEKIPDRSIILTHIPTMFLIRGQNAIQTSAGIGNPGLIQHLMDKYQGEVYFHYNYWCNTDTERNQKLCQAIASRYDLEEIAHAREQDYDYILYKMRLKEPKVED